ncbi:hypothetical protein DFH27DRAFT_567109 [Peziza echinospora]|nr:hypothetical protein DFH27DRAFT_567109 [Peziza echinospora]
MEVEYSSSSSRCTSLNPPPLPTSYLPRVVLNQLPSYFRLYSTLDLFLLASLSFTACTALHKTAILGIPTGTSRSIASIYLYLYRHRVRVRVQIPHILYIYYYYSLSLSIFPSFLPKTPDPDNTSIPKAH